MTADEFYLERRRASDLYENTMKGLWLQALPKEFSIVSTAKGLYITHAELGESVPVHLDKGAYYTTVRGTEYNLPKDIEALHSHLKGDKSVTVLKDTITKFGKQSLAKLMSSITNEFNSFPKILAAIVGDGWSYVQAKATDKLEIGLCFKEPPAVFGVINLTTLTVEFPHFEFSIRDTDTVLEIASTIVSLWQSPKNQWFSDFLKSCVDEDYDDDWFVYQHLLVKLFSPPSVPCVIYTTKQEYERDSKNPKYSTLPIDSSLLKQLKDVTSI